MRARAHTHVCDGGARTHVRAQVRACAGTLMHMRVTPAHALMRVHTHVWVCALARTLVCDFVGEHTSSPAPRVRSGGAAFVPSQNSARPHGHAWVLVQGAATTAQVCCELQRCHRSQAHRPSPPTTVRTVWRWELCGECVSVRARTATHVCAPCRCAARARRLLPRTSTARIEVRPAPRGAP